jgi:hypothetical protein
LRLEFLHVIRATVEYRKKKESRLSKHAASSGGLVVYLKRNAFSAARKAGVAFLLERQREKKPGSLPD